MEASGVLQRIRRHRGGQLLVLLAFCLVTAAACASAWLRAGPDFFVCSAEPEFVTLPGGDGRPECLECPACLPLQAPPPSAVVLPDPDRTGATPFAPIPILPSPTHAVFTLPARGPPIA